ncbi:DUF5067 domain-containing protein [Carnobacterium gallinarum]|uniref:DUF5067 domain-containing protein n=1 Tax=Carnobacterium gallinarum TaxID=2749 RepID=UPI00054FF931|nr:DUF5067 domain-containing protein [Carnobacterium gallinarum]
MMKWKALKLVGLFFFFFLLASCGAPQKEIRDSNKDFTYDKLYPVTESVATSDYGIQVTGYKIVKDTEDLPAIIVYYDFNNKTDDDDVMPYDIYMDAYQESNIQDGDDTLYEADLSGKAYDENETLFDNAFEVVESGGSIKAATTFKLRNNKHNVELEYYDSDEEYGGTIELNIEKEITGDSNRL